MPRLPPVKALEQERERGGCQRDCSRVGAWPCEASLRQSRRNRSANSSDRPRIRTRRLPTSISTSQLEAIAGAGSFVIGADISMMFTGNNGAAGAPAFAASSAASRRRRSGKLCRKCAGSIEHTRPGCWRRSCARADPPRRAVQRLRARPDTQQACRRSLFPSLLQFAIRWLPLPTRGACAVRGRRPSPRTSAWLP